MDQYINREEAIQRIRKAAAIVGFENPSVAIDRAIYVIERVPAADVAEIVRCRDCKHWKHFDNIGCTDFVKVCGIANYMIGSNGYCLYGERKEGAE